MSEDNGSVPFQKRQEVTHSPALEGQRRSDLYPSADPLARAALTSLPGPFSPALQPVMPATNQAAAAQPPVTAGPDCASPRLRTPDRSAVGSGGWR
jgi:hypothetical protein